MTPPPRLHVVTATDCATAVVLRRGPSTQVASILWDRASNKIELGQWLHGRIHEYRTDLSPDGKHLVYFACRAGRCWTVVSRAPWLRAIAYWPQPSSWHGGGAFTDRGALWLNGAEPPANLPDGLRSAATDAFPHSTDGFHMGGLFATMMRRRGWSHVAGEGYDIELQRPVTDGWTLQMRFSVGESDRALISTRYALCAADGAQVIDMPGWEWADLRGDVLQWAEKGALWQARPGRGGGLEDRALLHDFSDMTFEAVDAPYQGIQERPDQ
ncbi:hypothetical protein FGK63_04300 [Ruegeria sediminis]|uniref:Uncharacterized protein n=1 Tax=Ruegeria sediminis TaxID=2583820 RepID=A0ABY2X4I0_9RHOB|nr:hypothetical protein [Ruegeria sediminis]TMV10292.1 hypothetical protein FGK63_04300 [Ruegeria sediminis]